MEYKWKKDCKSFPGVYACDVLRANDYASCEDCKFYEPIKKILIIKYGAAGDILRSTTILSKIRKKYGEVEIYWLVNERDRMLIDNNPEIDKVFTFNWDEVLRLKQIKFKALFSLEIDKKICTVANEIDAEEKYGYYLDKEDNPTCFNEKAEYYLEKAWSDKLNKENRKTFQELLFDICELEYEKDDYSFYLDEYEERLSEKLREDEDYVIGISIGAGGRWPSKALPKDRLMNLIREVHKLKRGKILLIGGIQESELKEELVDELTEEGIKMKYVDRIELSTEDHIGAVAASDLVICGDTLTMHIALALKKKTIGLFFCTPDWEIEGYDRLKKIVSPLLEKYFFTDEYVKELINSIKIEDITKEIK